MHQNTFMRLVGVILIVLIAALSVIFSDKGWIRLVETLANIWFVIIGVVGTLAIQLISWPERFSKLIQGSNNELANSETVLEAEKTNFLNSIHQEFVNILDAFKDEAETLNPLSKTRYMEWTRKTEDEKSKLLGTEVYYHLRTAYEKIKKHNEDLEPGKLGWQEHRNSRIDTVVAIKLACEKTKWDDAIRICDHVIAKLEFR